MWHYKNILLTIAGLVVAFFLGKSPEVRVFISHLGQWGYLGAFLTGGLYCFTFTFALAIVALYDISLTIGLIPVTFFGGLGALCFDLLALKFVRNNLVKEFEDLFSELGHIKLRHLVRSKYFGWLFPVVGAIVIASPLPDELGVSLMGLSKISPKKFIVVSYLINSLGIFLAILVLKGVNF